MKNKIYFLLIPIFILGMLSCDDDDKTDQNWKKLNEQAYSKITVDPEWNEINNTPPGVSKGVYYKVLKTGKGTEHPLQTASVKVLYKGSFYDGTLFDKGTTANTFESVSQLPEKGEENVFYILWEEDQYSVYYWLTGKQEFEQANYSVGTTFFVNNIVGDDRVVRGLCIALQNMVVGDKWEICIPYNLGYGESGLTGNGVTYVKSYSTLFYEVEVLEINQSPL